MGALSTGGRGTPELWIGLECTLNRVGDLQGNPVINYCSAKVPFTRISEHR